MPSLNMESIASQQHTHYQEQKYWHVCSYLNVTQDLHKHFSLRTDDKSTEIEGFCILPKILVLRVI